VARWSDCRQRHHRVQRHEWQLIVTENLMPTTCNRIVIYTKKIEEMVRFYGDLFVYQAIRIEGDRIVKLRPALDGLILMLHPAGKGQKEGQSLIKLVFDVKNVDAFRKQLVAHGVDVGPIHEADGYQFANMKDPS